VDRDNFGTAVLYIIPIRLSVFGAATIYLSLVFALFRITLLRLVYPRLVDPIFMYYRRSMSTIIGYLLIGSAVWGLIAIDAKGK
jgi:hypothetical protein